METVTKNIAFKAEKTPRSRSTRKAEKKDRKTRADRSKSNDDRKEVSLKIRGLPNTVEIADIEAFFKDFKTIAKSVLIEVKEIDGQRTGTAGILLDSFDEA